MNIILHLSLVCLEILGLLYCSAYSVKDAMNILAMSFSQL